MSLENQITALTEAVIELTNALREKTHTTTTTVRVSPPTAGENDVVTDVKVKAPKAPKPAAASPQPETAAASPASEPKATKSAAPGATYDAVKAALIAVNEKHGRQLALDCLARVGVKNAKELDPAMYNKALEVFTEALENGIV